MAATHEGQLVEAARAGDQRAFGQLFDLWFDRVHDLSRRIVRDPGIAGEVAQDAFLTAWTKLGTLQDPDAFGGWLLRIARNGSLNRLAKEQRSVTLDDETMTAVTDAQAPDHDPLAHLDQAGRIALVWDAAAALGERDASVLDLHLRHGLGAAELAEELGTTPNNAHQILFTLRKRLGNSVRALVLWRAGHPTCADLRQGLAAAGLTAFGAPMVKAIDRHVDGCATCSTDRTERLSPAALFAAAPIVAAPILLKANAASALTEAGVPMSGSTAAAGTSAGTSGTGSGGSSGTGSLGRRQRMLLGVGGVIVLGLLLAVLLASRAGDGTQLQAGEATTTTPTVPAADPTSPVSLIPPISVDASDPTPTSAPPAPTTAAPTTVPAPVIDVFTATPTVASQLCDGVPLWTVTWQTTGADSAVVGRTTDKGTEQPADGSTTQCSPYGTVFFLNALGPGGTTSATAGGDPAPPTTTTTAPPTTTTTIG